MEKSTSKDKEFILKFAHDLLADDGLFLLHGIGNNTSVSKAGP